MKNIQRQPDINSTPSHMLRVWEAFDSIRCINLESRPDRREAACAEFSKIGAVSKVEFFTATKHPVSGRLGCADSHRQCMQQAYDAGHNHVLIFEDDVTFGEGWEEILDDCLVLMKSSRPWDAIGLGGAPLHINGDLSLPSPMRKGRKTKGGGKWWKGAAILAQAYVVSRHGMRAYLDNPLPTDVKVTQDVYCNRSWKQFYVHQRCTVITAGLVPPEEGQPRLTQAQIICVML